MNESKNFRVALLSGGSTTWREEIMPLLLAQTDYLTVADTIDQLLAQQPTAKAEMIFICHHPGNYDGITAAEQMRVLSAVTPLVLLAAGDVDTLKAALTVGACAVLEPPFSKQSFITAFNRCCHIAHSLRWEEYKQQQQKNRSELFMQSPCCHLFIDADGMVTSKNSRAVGIMGITTDSTPEFSDISRHFFAPYALTYPLEMEMAVQTQTAWNGILAGRLADAPSRAYRVISVPMTQADGASGTLLTLHDITTAQAEQSRLLVALQAARDCLTLVPASETASELLQLSTPEYHIPLVQEVFSLHTLLKSVTATTDLTIPDYLPQLFRGDSKRLGYALKAVFSGSSRFGEGGAHIAISIKERTPAMMKIQFNIRVNNSATPSDSYQSIVDYLATAAAIPRAATGLGLAAILIEQMNGSLLIHTERGCSRTVCCTVPILLETAAIPTGVVIELDAATAPLPALKVLVAEDNPLEQASLKHLLEGIGCQVIIVDNGKEAVDEFENGGFDVVLMDILMPVMDGFEATRLIREKERITGGTIPVVALTSYSLKAVQEKCVSVGMNGYLAKPVAKNKLLEALQSLNKLQGSSAQSEVKMSAQEELPVLETRQVLDNLDYDLETYRELVEMYLAGFAAVGEQLAGKLAGDDLTDIQECAHSLKGIVASIGGERLADIANRIQDLCRDGNKPASAAWAPLVTAETAALKEALEQLDWSALERIAAGK